MLTARVAERRLPRLTRSIAVTVRAGTPGGSYNDAYADDIALIPRVPRLPGVHRPGSGRRPFAGVLRAVAASADRPARQRARANRVRERNGRALRRRGDARPEAIRRARHAAVSRCSRGASGACASRSPGGRGARSLTGAPRVTCTRPRATARASPARPSRRCGSCAAVNLAACFSSLTSATRRPTSARSGTESWSSTGGSPPFASRPPTSSGPRCGACSACGAPRSTTSRRRSCRQPCPSWGRSGRPWPTAISTTGCRSSGPACALGWRSGSTIRARSAPTGS